ncbi:MULTISPECIES: hypothetical protein [Nocardia]|uniref:hypothetical protein n=1 Tax=Nocardia TaxID=1817 RepID=UPI000688D05F|nr:MULTISPECIES: hypothetical protein [Nocardia]
MGPNVVYAFVQQDWMPWAASPSGRTILPQQVLQPLLQLLGYLAWCVLLLCIARVIWVGGLLAIRTYREESVEGLLGALLGAALLGSASSVALAVIPRW